MIEMNALSNLCVHTDNVSVFKNMTYSSSLIQTNWSQLVIVIIIIILLVILLIHIFIQTQTFMSLILFHFIPFWKSLLLVSCNATSDCKWINLWKVLFFQVKGDNQEIASMERQYVCFNP